MVIIKVNCKCRLERPAPNEVFDFFFAFRDLVFDAIASGSKRLGLSLSLLIGRSEAFFCSLLLGQFSDF